MTTWFSSETLYDVLEINPDATPHEIRAAYNRLKMAYSKDSVALYSLLSREETEEMTQKLELAYQTLSNQERRREYDVDFGRKAMESTYQEPLPIKSRSFDSQVVSIDRVPPMDRQMGESLLIPPATDFSPSPVFSQPSVQPAPYPSTEIATSSMQSTPDDFEAQIASEKMWRGEFLKKIREFRNLSIEEMADHTKISKTYIRAIEAEDYSKLPAIVFLRGFLGQYSKKLKLPTEAVVDEYLKRVRIARPDK